jgi:hypothetical protein
MARARLYRFAGASRIRADGVIIGSYDMGRSPAMHPCGRAVEH